LFIETIINRVKEHALDEFDHVLFSYHGLPKRQLTKWHDGISCEENKCREGLNSQNADCYLTQCYETTRLIAEKLNLPKEKYSIGFQSRLDDKWIKPYSDKLVEDFAKKGMKKLLVLSPAFVADCLETVIEIQDEYEEIFLENGGEKLVLVESLNDQKSWIDALEDMVVNIDHNKNTLVTGSKSE